MKYLIKSTKGYWLEKGHGYTQSQNEAYAFTLEEMLHLGFNLGTSQKTENKVR